MKSRSLTCIITITLITALAVPVSLPAQEQAVPQFTVKDIGTLLGHLVGQLPLITKTSRPQALAGTKCF